MSDEGKTSTAKNYTGYLENEMTIMGILSTFCVLVAGGVVTVLSNIAKEHADWFKVFWNEQGPFIFSGLLAILLSSFFFYRERSLLSYYVGQIYLSTYDEELADGCVRDLHQRADNWVTWRFYRIAFVCLFTAAVFFWRVGIAQVLTRTGCAFNVFQRMRTWELWTPWTLCILLCAAVCMAFAAFPYADYPYKSSFQDPKSFFRAFNFLFKGGLE